MTKIVPMVHVPDVSATVAWYHAIGFSLDASFEDDGTMNWALMSLEGSEVMFNCGGQPSDAERREVDLYIHVDEVDAVYARLKGQVTIVVDLHDTFHGMREFVIRDLNRFWITFAQSTED